MRLAPVGICSRHHDISMTKVKVSDAKLFEEGVTSDGFDVNVCRQVASQYLEHFDA